MKDKQIPLSESLVQRVEARVSHTHFSSTADYIEYIVEEVLYHVEEEDESESVDESEVIDRLESLGYIQE